MLFHPNKQRVAHNQRRSVFASESALKRSDSVVETGSAYWTDHEMPSDAQEPRVRRTRVRTRVDEETRGDAV